MNGKDPVEQFNRELDGLFSGRRRDDAGSDPDAMETAEKLFRADFSGDSKIRESLRARLLEAGRGAGSHWKIALLFKNNIYARAAFIAACVLLVVLPVIHMRPAGTGPRSALSNVPQAVGKRAAQAPFPRGRARDNGNGPSKAEPAQRQAAAPAPGFPAGQRLFQALPVVRLAGERLQGSPIEIRKGRFPIVVQEGRKVGLTNGSGVAWETENAVFMLERRAISVEEIFQRKIL